MKTFSLLSHLAEFFLELAMFNIKVVQSKHTFYVQQLFTENCAVCETKPKKMWWSQRGHT